MPTYNQLLNDMVFYRIKRAAESRDANRLTEILQTWSVDTKRRHIEGTPAQLLALSGDHDAVDFLIAHGANVVLIAYAYSLAGDIPRVYSCLAQRGLAIPLFSFITFFAAALVLGSSYDSNNAVNITHQPLVRTYEEGGQSASTNVRTGITDELNRFINQLGKKPIKIIDDFKYPRAFDCNIEIDVPDIPVRLYGHLYNYEALMTWYNLHHTSPVNRREFKPSDIQPAYGTVAALRRIAELHSENTENKRHENRAAF